MIISQIADFLRRQTESAIPFTPIPLPILHRQTQHKDPQQHRRHHQQGQTDRKARLIQRRIRSGKDKTSNNAAGAAKTNLQPRRDRSLIFPTDVIRHHGPKERKTDVRARLHKVKSHVPNALRHIFLRE